MTRRRDEVAVPLSCGALVVVRVRVERCNCGRDDCGHPTKYEAADLIRLAVIEADVGGPA